MSPLEALDPFAPALAHLRAVDPRWGGLIDEVGPCGLAHKATPNLFAALCESIVYQQLHGKAAASIFARFAALFTDDGVPNATAFVKLTDDELRAAGLSRGKLAAIRDLASKTLEGALPVWDELEGWADEAIIERLTTVRGIGRWTVEMLLMFRLGRMDVLPVDDFGVRKGFTVAFRKRRAPTPRELARAGARWAPYRTIASWYLWRAAERAASKRRA